MQEPTFSSLNAWRWLECHQGKVSITKTERGRFQVHLADPSGENPKGILFERSTLLGVVYKAMEFEDRMALLTQNDRSELSVKTQRSEDRGAFRKEAGQHVASAFGVQVKEVH
jgi:hypothetical protein